MGTGGLAIYTPEGGARRCELPNLPFPLYNYCIVGDFRGIKFSRMAYFLKLADNIFADP